MARRRARAAPSQRMASTLPGSASRSRRRSWMGAIVADDGVGEPALALDAADAGGACSPAQTFGWVSSVGEDLVEIEDGADVGVAGVGAADARGVGDHGLELGAEVGFGLGEHDGVVVALGHLAAVEAGELGLRA